MEKNIILDHMNQKIKLSKKFARKATNAESSEFGTLQSVKDKYPNYSIALGVIKKKENKESYRGLTYEYMERYIAVYGNENDLADYKELRFLSECHSVKYPVIKRWFLEKFPDVLHYGVQKDFLSELSPAV